MALDRCPHDELLLGLKEFSFVAPNINEMKEEILAHQIPVAAVNEYDEVSGFKLRIIAHDGQLSDFIYYGSLHCFDNVPHGVGVAFSVLANR